MKPTGRSKGEPIIIIKIIIIIIIGMFFQDNLSVQSTVINGLLQIGLDWSQF